MIILAGTFRIADGQREAALPLLRAMAEASRQEAGCLNYSFAFDIADPHLVRVFEIYVDAAALQSHRDSAHMTTFRAARAQFGFHDRALTEYDVTNARDA